MDERYSWVIRFERKDGEPEEPLYFETETEAMETFRTYDDEDNAEIYDSIDLAKVDWLSRRESPIDILTF